VIAIGFQDGIGLGFEALTIGIALQRLGD